MQHVHRNTQSILANVLGHDPSILATWIAQLPLLYLLPPVMLLFPRAHIPLDVLKQSFELTLDHPESCYRRIPDL